MQLLFCNNLKVCNLYKFVFKYGKIWKKNFRIYVLRNVNTFYHNCSKSSVENMHLIICITNNR